MTKWHEKSSQNDKMTYKMTKWQCLIVVVAFGMSFAIQGVYTGQPGCRKVNKNYKQQKIIGDYDNVSNKKHSELVTPGI